MVVLGGRCGGGGGGGWVALFSFLQEEPCSRVPVLAAILGALASVGSGTSAGARRGTLTSTAFGEVAGGLACSF